MAVIDITQQDDFNKLNASPALAVVHFYADWAAQCSQMNDVIGELSKLKEYKDVKFAKLPAEDIPEVSLKYQITAVPTLILLKEGQLIDRVDGANAGELTKKINQAMSRTLSSQPGKTAPVSPENLNDRLKSLINAAPVMLFMKGTAQEPRCGFSRQIVSILDSFNTAYKTFDILNDEQVRQGLKEYSNWPTYPQLYVNGELIGGLDIIKEMQASGDLEQMLPKKQSLDERLKSLINQEPVMIFMKGNPSSPKCGFSRTLMEIMGKIGLPFKTFDILEDEDVRQGLKKFSNWPTYPQVYIKGELIGGLDIVKELNESGEFETMLKSAVQ